MDEANKVELEQLRNRLRMMTYVELVLFRVTAIQACAQDSSSDKFKVELEESKAEWKRRYPNPTE